LALSAAKSGLESAITVAQGILANAGAYYPASLTGLSAAQASAQAVNNDPNATPAQVTAAQAALVARIGAARLKAASPQSAPSDASILSAGAIAAVAAEPAQARALAAVWASLAAIPAAPLKAFRSAAAPKIKGVAKVGRQLVAKAGGWSPKPTLTYRWYRNGKAISGATAPVYKVSKADKGKRLTVKVKAAKPGYATKVKASAKTAKVAK
ncbi:MAG: hypothetical protein LBT54_03640, partial [Bifidobacteriaceae bacterium]|jgi:hypothetical protein|nr:hypothetical protein [Bifidobacteriaceae bacterium]